jgi:hypothetical protein
MNYDSDATALVARLIGFRLRRNANKTTKCLRSSGDIATGMEIVEQSVNCNSFIIEKRSFVGRKCFNIKQIHHCGVQDAFVLYQIRHSGFQMCILQI